MCPLHTYIVDQVDAPPPGGGHGFYDPRSPVLRIWICSKYWETKKGGEERIIWVFYLKLQHGYLLKVPRVFQISKWRTAAKITCRFGLALKMRREREGKEIRRKEETAKSHNAFLPSLLLLNERMRRKQGAYSGVSLSLSQTTSVSLWDPYQRYLRARRGHCRPCESRADPLNGCFP